MKATISLRLLVAVAVAVVASACAGIPSAGPVQKVADDPDLGQSAVRYSPARPLPGASPEQIVRGFLDAMLAFPASSRTASAFLTPAAVQSWKSSSRVLVYAEPTVEGQTGRINRGDSDQLPQDSVTVRLGLTVDAELDGQGRYTRRASPTALTYTLEKVRGEWRISDPQDGLLVDRKFFADYYRAFDLYYFDRPARRLVPDPVHLVVGDQLATTLLTSLAGGPDGDGDASRTYVPESGRLRPSVPVSDEGVADVEFTQDLRDLDAASRDRLSAQVVWTLRQVPGVEGVQIVGRTTSLTAGGEEVQPVQAWGGFGPSTARGRAYAVVDGVVVEIDGRKTQPVSGAWGKDARGAQFVAVSEAGVAAVLPGRDRVRLTSRDGSSPRNIRGSAFIGPEWDSDGGLWLLDRTSAGTRIRVIGSDGQRTIGASGVAGLDVAAFKLSPDGARYVVTGRGRDAGELYVGRVLRDTKDRIVALGPPGRVFTSVQSPRSASWSSGTELMFLAESQAGTQVYQARIDGSETTSEVSQSGSLLPDVGAATLAVGQGASPVLYVTDELDRLWVLQPQGSWTMLKTPVVTGLSYGR